jgi:hypothetical protein
VVLGVVQSVKPYGAFIDIGGVTGLLHVSQISHERIMNVDKYLSEGDKLKVHCVLWPGGVSGRAAWPWEGGEPGACCSGLGGQGRARGAP